jgi:hypothetical protein
MAAASVAPAANPKAAAAAKAVRPRAIEAMPRELSCDPDPSTPEGFDILTNLAFDLECILSQAPPLCSGGLGNVEFPIHQTGR